MGEITLQYPAPRQPDFLEKVASIDELMPKARKAAERTVGRGRLGVAQRGDKVLLVVPPGQDKLVLDAIILAFKEKEIEAESVGEWEVVGVPFQKLTRVSAADGWLELNWREQVTEMLGLEPPTVIDATDFLASYLDRNPKYNAVFAGSGGRSFYRLALGEKHERKFKDVWVYSTSELLLSELDEFPGELQALIERKIVELLGKVSEVRITDPQGTDIFFSVTPEEAKVWSAANPTTGHLWLYPALSETMLPVHPLVSSAKAKLAAEGISGHRVFCRAEGVIGGTSNHTGYFPHMKCYLKNGQIYKIEGGGKFGDLLREWMEKTKNAHYPGYPNPGNLYLWEIALGTVPKYFRARMGLFDSLGYLFANSLERNRSGVFHWGIGIEDFDPEVVRYAKEKKLPINHVGHAAHTYFNTYEVKLRETNEWVKIIDKGHLTALDDPEVKSIASKYGDPDDILAEEWVPAIPGINYPGDYMRDYGRDPISWIRKEIEGQLPATIGVPK